MAGRWVWMAAGAGAVVVGWTVLQAHRGGALRLSAGAGVNVAAQQQPPDWWYPGRPAQLPVPRPSWCPPPSPALYAAPMPNELGGL